MSQLEGAGTPENLALPLKLYWQPGCSSCLKMKEFVLEHGVPFESVNVLEDDAGFAELQELGVRMVPIAARGTVWANGAVFRDVAAVAGDGSRASSGESQKASAAASPKLLRSICSVNAGSGQRGPPSPSASAGEMVEK